MPNVKPLDLTIAFKRFEADKPDKAREFRAQYFNTLLPQALIDYASYTCERIYRESELPWLMDRVNWWKRHDVERRKRQRRLKKLKVELERSFKKNVKAYKLEQGAKQESDRQNAVELVHLFINEFNDRYKINDVDAKWYYQIKNLPKWIRWSNSRIEKNASEILAEIRSILIRRDDIRKFIIRNGVVIAELCGNPLGLRHPSCANRQCRDHYPINKQKELKKLQNTIFKVGTNKWVDEQKYKKYRKAALRLKNEQKIKEEYKLEKEWNYLEGTRNE